MTARAGEHRKLDDASICALNLVTRQVRQGIMAWGEREGGTHTTRFDRPTDGRPNEWATVTAAARRTRAGPPKVRWSKETIKMTSSSLSSLPLPASAVPGRPSPSMAEDAELERS